MSTTALSNAERDRPDEALSMIGRNAMNLEEVDGFFAALICGPETVYPAECLREISGGGSGEIVCESKEAAEQLLDLLMRHWSSIVEILLMCVPHETGTCHFISPQALQVRCGILHKQVLYVVDSPLRVLASGFIKHKFDGTLKIVS